MSNEPKPVNMDKLREALKYCGLQSNCDYNNSVVQGYAGNQLEEVIKTYERGDEQWPTPHPWIKIQPFQ